jgi:hypothetical protein
MSHFQRHPEIFDKPIYLTEEEMKSPLDIIEDFFSDYRLCDIREIHRDTVEACLSTDIAPFEDAERRAELILYSYCEERMMEAATLLVSKPTRGSVSENRTEMTTKEAIIPAIDMHDLQRRVIDLQGDTAELGGIIHRTWTEARRSGPNSSQKNETAVPVSLDIDNLHSKFRSVEGKVAKLVTIIIVAWGKTYAP